MDVCCIFQRRFGVSIYIANFFVCFSASGALKQVVDAKADRRHKQCPMRRLHCVAHVPFNKNNCCINGTMVFIFRLEAKRQQALNILYRMNLSIKIDVMRVRYASYSSYCIASTISARSRSVYDLTIRTAPSTHCLCALGSWPSYLSR